MPTLADSSPQIAAALLVATGATTLLIGLWLSARLHRKARTVQVRRDRLHAWMMRTHQAVVRCKNRETVFTSVCRLAVEAGAFRVAWVKVENKETGAMETVACAGASEAPSTEIQSAATFSLMQEGRVIGGWTLDAGETNFFKDEERRLCTNLAEEISFSLDTLAREAQREGVERALRESQSRLKLAMEATHIGLWDWDLITGKIYLSPEWKSQLGFAEGEMSEDGTEWRKRIHPEDGERVAERVRRYLAGNTPAYEAEFRLQHRDGSYRWISSRAQAVRDARGEAVRLVGWQVDITARRQAEEAMRASEARLQSVIENLGAGMMVSDLNGQLLHWNQAALAMHHFSGNEDWLRRIPELADTFELSTSDGRVLSPEEWPLMRIIRGEPVRNLELNIRRLDMDWGRIFSYAGARVDADDNSPIAFLTMVDITERAKAAQATRESEARFRELAEHVDEVFWIIDPVKLKTLYVSPAYEKIWGRVPDSNYQNHYAWLEAVHAEDRARVRVATLTKQESGNYDETYRIIRPDGTQRWIRDRAFPVRNTAGHVYRIVGTAQDITARKRAEVRQNLQQKITSVFADARPLPETAGRVVENFCRAMEWGVGELWMLDRAAGCLRCVTIWHTPTPLFAEFAMRSREMVFKIGQGLPGRICNDNEPLWTDALTAENAFTREHEARLAGLHTAYGFPVRVRDEAVGVLLFFGAAIPPPDEELRTLATNFASQLGQFVQRLRIEEQFLQSQKMEAIGQLAGGVAHDFNNLLTVIKAYPQLILLTPNLTTEVRDWLEQMAIAADRAAGLTRQLLAFSRKQVLSFQSVDLNEVVKGMDEMLRRIIGEDIALHFECAPLLGLIQADHGMLEQIVMNFVVNARDAMPRGGRLTVKTAQVKIDPTLLRDRARARSGDFVTLAVTDTGSGMSPAVMQRIFEPFFTTKEPGLGTGLGLATIYGIAEQHQGWVEVESVEDSGSTFTVFFPLSRTNEEVPAEAIEGVEMSTGRETILLVEDEPAVRLLSKMVLERLGYRVYDAVSGVVGLEVWAQHREEINLLITDIVMPHGVTGRDLAEKLRLQNPSLKILFTTGYSPAGVARGMKLIEGVNFIQKPYAPQVFAQAIRSCMERPPLPIS